MTPPDASLAASWLALALLGRRLRAVGARPPRPSGAHPASRRAADRPTAGDLGRPGRAPRRR